MIFEYENTTKIVFGEGQIAKLSTLINKDEKILITIGGGSVKRNGTLEQVEQALAGYDYDIFEGIEPNPQFLTLMKAVNLVKEHGYSFILAVGGGSVIDGSKFISAAACYNKDDEENWHILETVGKHIEKALPMGCVLTLPATGSETNTRAMISYKEKDKKTGFISPIVRAKFAILDPTTTLSLPKEQTINGIVDAYIHILEQYLVDRDYSPVLDRAAEGLLKVLVEEGPKILQNPNDIKLRAELMYCATLALNEQLCVGVKTDWSTHILSYELTVAYGIDHGASLSMLLPTMLTLRKQEKANKLATYAQRVHGIENATADDGIAAIEGFLKQMESPIKIPYKLTDADAKNLAMNLAKQKDLPVGENANIDMDFAKRIYLQASI